MVKAAARVLRGVGALGAVAGCASMTAMLPSAAASAFAGIGLTGSTVAGRALVAVAEPLFVVSAVLLIVGALACSRLATSLAGVGSVSAFVGMFVLAGRTTTTHMAAMGGTSLAAEPLFYLGVILIAASLATTLVRRRRRTCLPLFAAFGPHDTTG